MTRASNTPEPAPFSPDVNAAVVRYQVRDVDRAFAFYTERLGFQGRRLGAAIAIVSRGDLHLLLSGLSASGSRPMPDGRRQEPGGWNRIVVYVKDLDVTIGALRSASSPGTRFLNEVEAGPGGKQILIEDPDGNAIELHEAPRE
jgi:glyoxylase I family protein